MQGQYLQHDFVYIEVDSMIIGKARNMMVETAIPQNVDVVMMIDDDVLVPLNAGELIAQALSLDIVTGVYYNRRMPYTPQIYELAKEPEYEGTGLYWPIIDVPKEISEVDACGFGCIAIKMNVFKELQRIHEARFKDAARDIREADPSLEMIARLVENMSPWFEFLNRKGEDMYFCERAREAGFHIWVDPSVQCEHISMIPITWEHFEYLKAQKSIVKEIVS